MIEILISVFTCPDNKKYFDVMLNSLRVSLKDTYKSIKDIHVNFQVIDYSMYNTGFCQNFNTSVKATKFPYKVKYFIYLNDDISLHPKFITNAINYLEQNEDVGFLGGHSQIGGWNQPIDNIRIPEPIDKITELKNMARLNWEFSACVFPVKVLDEVGEMDELFSPRIGLISDNDYLIRIKKAGYRAVRNYNCTFFHAKAVSQSRIRNPMDILEGIDSHTIRAHQVMLLKWGMNIPKGEMLPVYEKPYNNKHFEFIDINTIKLDNEIIKLIEV